jgi:hypothetical protein
MSNRALLAVTALVVALLAIATVTTIGADDDTRPAPTSDPGPTTGPPVAPDAGLGTTPGPSVAVGPDEPDEAEETDPDVGEVATDSPEPVATAWACAYWSHPRGETAEQLAGRLAPLSTPELTIALSQLRIPFGPDEVVSVISGATVPGPDAGTYEVGCQTVTTTADGTPTAPTAARNTEVRLTRTADGWRVAGATVGGLTLPGP